MAVVGLEETSYRVLENVSVVEVCAIVYSPINTSCPIPFLFDVRLSTIDDSAGNIHMILYSSIIHSVLYTTLVTPMDYGAVNDTLSFEACDIRRCVNVTIINDEVLEGVESLDVTLERTPGLDNKITVMPVDGEIIITDDDGMFNFLHSRISWYLVCYCSGCGWSGGDFHFCGRGYGYSGTVCYYIHT